MAKIRFARRARLASSHPKPQESAALRVSTSARSVDLACLMPRLAFAADKPLLKRPIPHSGELLPAIGVYITTLKVGAGENAKLFRGVTNVGNRPTFGADSFAVETHLLDFEPIDLFEDTPLEMTFLKRLRAEQKFDSPALLQVEHLSKSHPVQCHVSTHAVILGARNFDRQCRLHYP